MAARNGLEGKRKLKQKDYQGAITKFDQALASNPNDLDALSGKGEAYYWQKNFEAAIENFDTVL
ncbi:MAG: tetratricopeptide repeat protein [Cyanobacteria bacterium P01_G01_bin.39]